MLAIQITSTTAGILDGMTATEPTTGILPSWRKTGDGRIGGVGVDPTIIANSVLRSSFDDFIPIEERKLQFLMYLIACLYMRQSGLKLLSEPFQARDDGPVIVSLRDRLRHVKGSVPSFVKGPNGKAQLLTANSGNDFRRALGLVWENLSGYDTDSLSRLVTADGSAWQKAWAARSTYIDDVAMADDDTFLPSLGLVNL